MQRRKRNQQETKGKLETWVKWEKRVTCEARQVMETYYEVPERVKDTEVHERLLDQPRVG